VFFCGEYVPLVYDEMVVIKEFKKGEELILIVEQVLQSSILQGDELVRLELGDFVPDGFAESAGEELLKGDRLWQRGGEADAGRAEGGGRLADGMQEHKIV
jgi:hypothetical protein